jgi:iron complex outermembrane receptor protein
VAAFRSHFKDFQAQGGLFLPGSPLSSIVLLNAGKLLTQGFEAELAATLGDSTYLGMNATFIDATFKEFKNAQCYPGQTAALGCTSGVQDLTGARLPNTPEWSVNLLGSQEFALPGTSWRGYITGDYSWRSSVQWHNLDSPYGVEPSYGLLGASLGVRSENDRVNFKLYGKNLTDKFHTSGIAVGEQVTHFLPPDYRRVIGIDATFRL